MMDDATLLAQERWLPIPGFEGLYEVSDFGRLRSLRMINTKVNKVRETPRIMAGARAKDGRRRIVLTKSGTLYCRPVGVFVLLAFVGPRPAKQDCRHLDGDAGNDDLGNLQWSSHAVNMADMRVHGTYNPPPVRRGETNNKAILTTDDVRCIRAEPNYRGVNAMLGRAFGLRPESIRNIRAGLTWKGVAA